MRPQDPCGPWPSLAEELQAIYLDWRIEREMSRGRHGDWVARPLADDADEKQELRAPDIEALRLLLVAHTMADPPSAGNDWTGP